MNESDHKRTWVAALAASCGLFCLAAFPSNAFGNPVLSYQGRILKADGDPFEAPTAQFRIEIRSPLPSDCRLYRETRPMNMANSNGFFKFQINDGAPGVTVLAGSLPIDQALSNRKALTVPTTWCGDNSGLYTPGTNDNRRIVVEFYDGSTWEAMPAIAMNPAPSSVEALQVGGFKAQNLLRVVDGSNDPYTVSPLTNTQYDDLMDLLAGTSILYTKPNELAGQPLPTLGTGQDFYWNGTTWVAYTPVTGVEGFAQSPLPACAPGHFLRNDGTGQFECVDPGTGGSVSIVTGSGLTGGPITSTGTIALESIHGASGSAVKPTYDVHGRITGSTALAETDLPTISTAGKVSGDAITSGTIAGSTTINTSGNITTTGEVHADSVNTTQLLLRDTGVNTITFEAPTLGGSYVLVLPDTNGTPGQVLTTDGSGILSWSNPASGSVNSVGVTAPIVNSGTATDPVIGISDATTAAKGAVQLAADGGTTAGTVVQATDARLSNSRAPTGAAGGDLSGSYPSPTVGGLEGVDIVISSIASGNFLKFNGTNWVNATPGISDITGLQTVLDTKISAEADPKIGTLTNTKWCTSDGSQVICNTDAPVSGTGDVIIGGNTVASTMTVGTNSNHDFAIETNGTTKMTVLADGRVGIGTATPSGTFHVVGGTAAAGNGADVRIEAQSGAGSGNTDAGNVRVLAGQRNASGQFGTVFIGSSNRSFPQGNSTVSLKGDSGVNTTLNVEPGFANTWTQTWSDSGGGFVAGMSEFGTLQARQFVAGTGQAFTTNSQAVSVNHTGTSSTASVRKSGVEISSTGTWNGTGASNIGLYVSSVTGGTNNYDAIFNGGGNVGIGTLTPAARLSLVSDGSTDAFSMRYSGNSTNPMVYQYRSRGTASAMTAPQSGDSLGGFSAGAYNGASLVASTASVQALAGENFSPTNNGTLLQFSTTPLGSTTATERMRISASGNVGIGETSPARVLHVAGPMRITASTAPGTPALGDIYVDSGDNKLKYHNGTGWVDAGGSGGGGTVTDVTASGVLTSSGGTTPDIALNIGNGLTTVSSSLTMNLGNGLEFNTGAVRAKAGDAILVDGDGINVLTGTVAGAVMPADGVPNCAANEKLQMSLGPAYNWTCVADQGLTSESDPQVGTLTNGKWCTTDGTSVNCTSDAPGGDVLNGGNTVSATMVLGTNSNHDLGLETNGTTKMTVLADGKVGIGTSVPDQPFDVLAANPAFAITGRFRTSAGASAIQVEAPNGSTAGIMIRGSGGNNPWQALAHSGETSLHLIPNNNINNGAAHSVMSLVASGRVGIGNGTPNSQFQVDSASGSLMDVSFGQGGFVSGGLNVGSNTKAVLRFSGIHHNGGSARITGVSNVPNGGTVPLALVGHHASSPGSYPSVVIQGGKKGGGASPTDLAATEILLQVQNQSGTGLMTVMGNGAVGIGNSSPARPLHVEGPMRLTASSAPSSPALGDIYVDSGDNKLKYHNGTGWVDAGGSGGGGTVTDVTASGVLASTGGTTPDISLNIGNGLTTVSSSLTMNLGNGLEFNTGAVRAKAGDAILVDGDGINVLTGTVAGAVMAADGVPNCAANEKLQMSLGPAYNWTCVADQGLTSESDPQVGTLTNGKWCTTDGTSVNCTSDAPGGDVLNGGNTVSATMVLGTNSNHDLGLETNGTTKMTVLADGKVGIGTAGPAKTLHVATGTAGDGIRVASSVGNATAFEFIGSANGNDTLLTGQVGGAIFSIGKINGTPNWNIANGSNLANASLNLTAGGGTTAGPINFRTGAYSAPVSMAIVPINPNDGAGTANVGIGTTSPARLLHVAGPMRITASTAPGTPALGDIYVDSGDNKLKYHNGTGWVDAGGSGGGGTVTDVTASGVLASTGGTTPDISLNIGDGLTTVSSSLTMNLGNGLEFNTGAVRAKAGDAILVDGDGINVLTGTVAGAVMAADGVPNCAANEKLQMSLGPAYNWTCVADQGLTSESDPQVGTLTNGKWCTTDGTSVNCTSDAPAATAGGATTQVQFNSSNALAGSANFVWDNTNSRLGLGTSSPTYPLTLRSADQMGLAFENAGSGNKQWRLAGFGNDLYLTESGIGHQVVFKAGGRVGIGTTAPATALEVRQSTDSSLKVVKTNDTAIYLTAKTGAAEIEIEGSASEPLLFKYNTVEKMRMTESGNFGIGTTSPARLLHVAGPLRLTPTTAPTSPAAGDVYVDSGDSLLKYWNGSAWVSAGGSGDVLIGGNTATGTMVIGSNSNHALELESNGTSRLRIETSGAVNVLSNLQMSGINAMRFPASDSTFGNSIAIGANALVGQTTSAAYENIAIGANTLDAAMTTAAQRNIAIGSSALSSITSGRDNVAIGNRAGDGLTTTEETVIIGSWAAPTASFGVVAVGGSACNGSGCGWGNTAIGNKSIYRTGGQENVAIGFAALGNSSYNTANSNVVIGYSAASSLSSFNFSNSVFIGKNADSTATTTTKSIAIGDSVTVSGSNQLNIGNAIYGTNIIPSAGTPSIGIGVASPARTLHVAGPMRITASTAPTSPAVGDIYVDSGDSLLKSWNGSSWVSAGGVSNIDGLSDAVASGDRLYLGTGAGSSGDRNTAVGVEAMDNASGDYNTAVGYKAMDGSSSGHNNTAMGAQALELMTGSSADNVAIGFEAGQGTGSHARSQNVLIGALAGTNLQTGSTNVMIGYNTGNTTTTGQLNVLIGSGVLAPAAGTSNYLNIGNAIYGTNIIPSSGSPSIGIGEPAPARLLHVAGPMRITASTAPTSPALGDMYVDSGDSKLKYHNGTGWVDAGGSGSGDVSNGGNTVASTMVLGTNSNHALEIETNGTTKMTILADGSVGIGTAGPGEKLEVVGNVKATNFISTSDARLKTNVSIAPGLQSLMRLRGVNYNWKSNGIEDMGLIAQEVEEVFPHSVVTDPVTGMKAVKYQSLIAPLIEATKEVHGICEVRWSELSRDIASLKSENLALKNRVQSLEERLSKLEKLLLETK